MIIKEVMNSDRDRNKILLKMPVIAPYYLFLVMEQIIFVIIPLLTVKIGRSRNLTTITVLFGLHNNLLPLIFILLFCFQRAFRSCFLNFTSLICVMIHER